MNDIQKTSFEILNIFIDICKKLNLKWFLVNGSALGAVKYKGFIPWDDDIDVALPRKDYEIFLEKAQSFLPENIFIQNYRTDKYFPQIFSKLRNSNTTFIENSIKDLNINHGIYIDIFPLDIYPSDNKKQVALQKKRKILSWKTVCAIKDKSETKIIVRNLFFRFFGYHRRTQKYLAQLDRLISSYNNEESSLICNFGDRMSSKRVMPKEIYGDGIKVSFEDIEVIIPQKYDEYLTHKYGNWREDPPKEQQNSHHHTTICDTKKPYTEYVKY